MLLCSKFIFDLSWLTILLLISHVSLRLGPLLIALTPSLAPSSSLITLLLPVKRLRYLRQLPRLRHRQIDIVSQQQWLFGSRCDTDLAEKCAWLGDDELEAIFNMQSMVAFNITKYEIYWLSIQVIRVLCPDSSRPGCSWVLNGPVPRHRFFWHDGHRLRTSWARFHLVGRRWDCQLVLSFHLATPLVYLHFTCTNKPRIYILLNLPANLYVVFFLLYCQ